MRSFFTIAAAFLALCLWSFPAPAQHQHGGHSMSEMSGMEGEKKAEPGIGDEASPNRTFLLEGGVKASFTISPMAEYKKMLQEMKMKVGVAPKATHDIDVTLTDTRSNQPLTDAVVKMTVIDAKGKEQTKLLDFTQAMNQYSGDFSLSEKGKYQILILFKSGGKKYPAGFYYLLK